MLLRTLASTRAVPEMLPSQSLSSSSTEADAVVSTPSTTSSQDEAQSRRGVRALTQACVDYVTTMRSVSTAVSAADALPQPPSAALSSISAKTSKSVSTAPAVDGGNMRLKGHLVVVLPMAYELMLSSSDDVRLAASELANAVDMATIARVYLAATATGVS